MRVSGKVVGVAVMAVLVAGAALGAPSRRATVIVQPKSATASGLRGAEATGQARARTSPPAVQRASLPPLATPVAAIDSGQCRAACARPYYFCLANDDTGSCPQTWSRCLVACDGSAGEP
jgi:hypothetical protein